MLHGIASAMNTEGKKTTATGIYDLRLLQIKRCGPLGPGPSSRLTVARLSP